VARPKLVGSRILAANITAAHAVPIDDGVNPVGHADIPDLATAVAGSITAASGSGKATGSPRSRANADRFGERANSFDHGAIANDNVHPLSERYATLAVANVDYPAAVSLAEQIDGNALRSALTRATTIKGAFDLAVGKYVLTAGQTASGWLYGTAPDRWGAPVIRGAGARQSTILNGSADYTLTYTLANTAHVYDSIIIDGLKIRTQAGGGIDFVVGIGQSQIHGVEFDGMDVNKFALRCDNANGMFTANISDCRFWTEEFQFNGNILSLGGTVNVNVNFHDNFITHMKANAANAVVNNGIITAVSSNQFEHTGGATKNINHTFWSFTGFNFGASFVNNYLEGTWGCFVRAGAASGALIGVEIRNLYAYEYDETITGGGTPAPFIADFRNLTKNAHVEGVTVINGCTSAGGGYLFDDPWHAMDGEGVHRFWHASAGAQLNRKVSQLLTGKSHTGAVVSVYNQNESWRRTGRGIFPVNANQGVGNPTNFTVFLPTDVGPTNGAWTTATTYQHRDTVSAGGNVYEMRSSVGISGASAPTGTSLTTDVGDGVLLWRYLRADNDLNKVQPGGYLLAVTIRATDKNHAATGLYYVIFDDQSTDYTTVMQIGTTQTKGTPPTSLAVTTTNRGVLTVTANQGVGQAHECSFAWTKMQAL
jgi:hypothetical protein